MEHFKNNYFRELRKSKKSLIAMFFLFLLGTSLFIGGQVIYPTMLNTANHYYQTYHLPDATVKSAAGFTSDDYDTLKEKTKPATSYLGYSQFAISDYKQQVTLIRSISATKTQQKKAPYQLKQGSFPRKSGEIALDQKMANIYPLGSKITFLDDLNQQTKNQLKKTTYQVVGFVSSPEFIQTQARGISPIGNGEIAFISVILEKDFNLSNKNDFILTYQGTKNKTHYQASYQQERSKQTKQTSATMNNISIQKMEEAKEALLTKQEDIEAKITDLTAELTNQKTELSDSEKIIAEQKAALESEKNELAQQLAALENDLLEVQATFQQNEQVLIVKTQEVEKMTATIEASEALLEENQTSLEEFSQLVEANQEQLATYQDSLDTDLKKIKQIKNPSQRKEAQQKYDSRSKDYQTELEKVAAQRTQLEDATKQLAANEAALAQQNETLETALDELSQFEERFSESESNYEEKLSEKEDIQQSQNELTTSGSETLAEDEIGLAELKESLAQQKGELDAEIKKETADKKQIDKQIKQVKPPAFSIAGPTDNLGYVAYQKELLRLKYVTQIVPVIIYGLTLLLASILLFNSLRNNRQKINTLKALGIHPVSIFAPALLLNTGTALLGSLAGSLIGSYGIPTAVFKLYQKSYLIDNYQFSINYQALAIALGMTLLVSILPNFYYYVSYFHNSQKKSGPSSTQQVFRLIYSVIIPITFVVTLLFAGLNSLQTVQSNFIKETPAALEVKLQTSKGIVNNQDYLKILHYYSIEAPSLVHKEDITLANASSLSLIVPQEKTSTANLLATKGAILTEKSAENHRLKIGDSLIFYDAKGKEHSLIIEKILKMEQEGLYLTPAYYKDVFAKESTFDTLQLKVPATLNQRIGTGLLEVDTVGFKGMIYEPLENTTTSSTTLEDATDRLATLLLNLPTVTEVSQKDTSLQNDSLVSLRKLISIFILITICLTVTTLSCLFFKQLAEQAENSKILTTLGFEKQKIHASILRKSYLAVLIGCLLGGIGGMAIYTTLSKKLVLHLPISFSIMNYIWTLLIIILLSLVVIKLLNKIPFNLNRLPTSIHDFFLRHL